METTKSSATLREQSPLRFHVNPEGHLVPVSVLRHLSHTYELLATSYQGTFFVHICLSVFVSYPVVTWPHDGPRKVFEVQ